MAIIADTHVHLYGCYDFSELFRSAFTNLRKHDGESMKALLLAERSDCNFFSLLKGDGLNGVSGDYRFENISDPCCVKVINEGGEELYIFSGRQVVTKERLEILSLLTGDVIEDGMPALNVVEAIREAGGVPVLSWALGKWMFERGHIVRSLIAQSKPGQLLIGDTYMRPAVFSDSAIMKVARCSGLSFVAGTDPLPFKGEEKLVGQYASRIEGNVDVGNPVGSLRSILLSENMTVLAVGSRGSVVSTIRRRMR